MKAFHILNRYYDGQSPRATGHDVIANSEKHAIEFATRHKIGCPFGRVSKIDTLV